ncbi:uncharacterized protein Dwil_GK25064 [Drosophila willistoni]|uniref:Mitochondrial import inner membrane translocase subunit n=1 Tax=Drosophila willistoni TaxID=7260 RepID=B4NCL0_DROWI|nr:mitochondrial import inner membrane translocase subunit Tim10B [Drosophila willistoni]EDW82569.1 uncharacterized protein Dwil_GK25064 [Drosophila willistoni]
MDSNLRNLKDFLVLYNKVTELCFNRCVDNLNQRELGSQEDTCVDRCVTKFARFNENMMKVYVDVQTTINAKRVKEMEEQAAILEKQQQEERKRQSETAILTPVSPSPNPGSGNLAM